MKKILLLTDIPPCKSLTAGLVLDQLCRFLPEGSIACYAVVNPEIPDAKLSPDLDWIPIKYTDKPREKALRILPWVFGSLTAYLYERYVTSRKIPKIIDEIAAFGREVGAERLWCVMQGQTLIKLAVPVASKLRVPLHTQIWDPPTWWLRDNQIDKFSGRSILKYYESALLASKTCATASWAMAEEYGRKYNLPETPVISSRDRSFAADTVPELSSNGPIRIGMAGQLYASREWLALLGALNSVNWMILGRDVKIVLLGRSVQVHADCRVNVEYLGWASQEEAVRIMSETDLLYCPYWFSAEFEEESRLCFPSKLITYLAAGKPVLFHGPEYASPAKFLKDNAAGYLCSSLDSATILTSIENILGNADLFRQLSVNGLQAFHKFFTLERMKEDFFEFLGETSEGLR